MFKEPEKGKKDLNVERTEEALATGATTIAVACPFCMTMMSDGVKAKNRENDVQVKDLAEAVAAVIPGVKVSINTEAPPDKRSYRVNFDLYKKIAPNHQPQYDLARTILELKEGLEAMKFNDAAFRDSKLMRLKVLTSLQSSAQLGDDLKWRNN